MANRLIRDGLIESEAVLSLPVEARWLYVTVLLSADDVGLFEATEFHLARKADLNRPLVGKLLQMLVDADLVRLYQGPGMRQLGFIPRFRQRLQIQRSRLHAPPPALYADDEDAVKKFNDLAAKKAVDNGDPPRQTVGQPPEPNLNLTEPELKKTKKTSLRGEYSDQFEEAWAAYPTRPGAVKKAAWRAWQARIKGGIKADEMTAAVKRYAAWCVATRKDPQYIKQPATFFGPDEHFAADWSVSGTSRVHIGSTAGMNYQEGFDNDGKIL